MPVIFRNLNCCFSWVENSHFKKNCHSCCVFKKMHHQKLKVLGLQLFVKIAWVNCRVVKGSDICYEIGRHIQNKMREQDISLSAWQGGLSWWYVQDYQACLCVSLSPFSLTLSSISGKIINIYQQHLLGIYLLGLGRFTSPEPLMCSDSDCA